jgi:hypothetical protein
MFRKPYLLKTIPTLLESNVKHYKESQHTQNIRLSGMIHPENIFVVDRNQ